MAKSQRFEMRVTPRWRREVKEARERLRMSSDSDFVFLATEEVASGRVIPTAWVEESLSLIEGVSEHLRASGVKRNAILAERLEDAAHCLSAARDGELPEDSVWLT